MRRIYKFAFVLASLQLYGFVSDIDEGPVQHQFWHVGPIVSGPATTKHPGHVTINPWVEYSHRKSYNKHWGTVKQKPLKRAEFRLQTVVGITDWMDILIRPIYYWNDRQSITSWAFGDLRLQLDFQLYRDQSPSTSWMPSMRLIVREMCPTGKYQHLDPKKLRTDRGGNGAWETTIGLDMGKVFDFGHHHFLNALVNIHFGFAPPVHVKGFNAFGGGYGTHGTAYPERKVRTSLAFEYALSQNWIVALDNVADFWSKTRFKGKLGTAATNTRPASIQYSIAPSIEYVWNKHFGASIGPWWTVAGRNSAKFSSLTIFLLYSG